MESDIIIIVCSILVTDTIILIAGICLGVFITKMNSHQVSQNPVGFLKNQGHNNNKIEIDDKKVVLSINTTGLEKKFDKITEETKIDNDISSSVNKLKNMKGKL